MFALLINRDTGFSNTLDMTPVRVFLRVVTLAGVNKHLKRILTELNIHPTNMTSTGLRYSYCSFLIANKVDIWAVSKLMGHKDIKQITQTYGHLIKEKADEENQKVRNFMGSLNENEKG